MTGPNVKARSLVDDTLADLLQESRALTVMLVTKQGTEAAQAGAVAYLNTTAMAALVAGMFSATREVARMVGENQFSILLQQGERRHIHVSLVTPDMMMVIVFEDQNRIGMIRHAARKAGEKLACLLPEGRDREKASSQISLPEFREYALNLIDRIFMP